jgi:hypothetical protein
MLAGCATHFETRDLGAGYSIRRERDRSALYGEGYREALFYEGEFVTAERHDFSPSRRYVFYEAFGNWYLFDSETKKTRFLRRASFRCMVKFYESSQPRALVCFDLPADRKVEMAID